MPSLGRVTPPTPTLRAGMREDAEDKPPQRALDAASTRGDVVEQTDRCMFVVCRKGVLEWYRNDEWVGGLSRLELDPVSQRCRGVVRTVYSSRGTWDNTVLPRGLDSGVLGQLASLADKVEVMHNIPSQTHWAEARQELVELPSLERARRPTLPSSPMGRSSGFTRRCLGLVSRMRGSSPVLSTTISPPVPSPVASTGSSGICAPPRHILQLAKENGACVEIEMKSSWMLCKRGRVERLVDGEWREAVTKILTPSSGGNKVMLQDTAGRTKIMVMPSDIDFLPRLATLAERGGVVHELATIPDEDEASPRFTRELPTVVTAIPHGRINDTFRMQRILGDSVSFWPLSASAPQPMRELDSELRSSSSSPGPEGTATGLSSDSGSVPLPGTPTEPDAEKEGSMCVVCLEGPKNTVLFPCRHLCSCARCSVRMERCPLCRKEIEHRVEVWVSA
eukprot:Hpha_TRINITY_DN15885_c0_g1::TRINITY_DN15885_c0_g1_i1::g.189435::m.189435